MSKDQLVPQELWVLLDRQCQDHLVRIYLEQLDIPERPEQLVFQDQPEQMELQELQVPTEHLVLSDRLG